MINKTNCLTDEQVKIRDWGERFNEEQRLKDLGNAQELIGSCGAEVACLRQEHVNKAMKLLLIKGSDASKGKKGAKRGKDRNIPIAPEVMRGLRYLPVGSDTAKDAGVRALQIAWNKATKKALGNCLNVHILRHCLSEDTEVLTKQGWKNYKDLLIGEEIFQKTGEK